MNFKKNLKNQFLLLLFILSKLAMQNLNAMAEDTTEHLLASLSPKITITTQAFGSPGSSFFGSISYTQGNRRYMEDTYCIQSNLFKNISNTFYSIFDGHGGVGVANYLKENLLKNILSLSSKCITPETIAEGFTQTNNEILSIKDFYEQGSTALCAFILGSKLIVANAGDCRAVLYRNGQAIPLSKDHKASNPDEKARIEQTGAYVLFWKGLWRVNTSLAVSRSFGDDNVGNPEAIKPIPEIKIISISPQDEFLILASDGLWDSIENQQAVEIVKSSQDLQKAARNLVLTAFQNKTPCSDNITVIIIDLRNIRPIQKSSSILASHREKR